MELLELILGLIRNLLLIINLFVYNLVAYLYNLFLDLSQVSLLEDDKLGVLYDRIGLILVVFMFFKLAFMLIGILIDPDKMSDKEKGLGSIIKKSVVMVILLAVTPTIFEESIKIQDAVIKSDAITNLLLVKKVDADDKGFFFATNLFFLFSADNEEPYYSMYNESDEDYNHLLELVSEVQGNESFMVALDYFGETSSDYYCIEFDVFSALLALIVGGVVLFMLAGYCIDVAIRVVQFTFLRVIAPVPIMSYLSTSKENAFSKWVKQCVTTYLDLFIRLIILNFISTMATLVLVGDDSIVANLSNTYSSINGIYSMIIKCCIIIGLFLFMKRAPKLIQELIGKPNAASIGYGIMNEGSGALAGAAMMGATNFFGNTGVNRLTGLAGGLLSGASTGSAGAASGKFGDAMAKAKKEAQQRNLQENWLKQQGYGFGRRQLEQLKMNSGAITSGEDDAYMAKLYKDTKALIDDEDQMKDIAAFESTASTYGMTEAIRHAMANNFLVQDPATGQYTWYDRDGNKVLDLGTNIDFNTIKDLKKTQGNIIAEDKKNEAVQTQLKRLRKAELRHGISSSKSYNDIKNGKNKYSSRSTRNPLPFGRGGPPA